MSSISISLYFHISLFYILKLFQNFFHVAVQLSLLKGYKIRGGSKIIYIFYADDCLLIAWVTLWNVIYLFAILNAYCMYSRQTINNKKSHILFSPCIECTIRQSIEVHHEKWIGWFYLGAPLSGTSLQPSDFQFLLNKITSKVMAWKWRILSLAGRMTSLQSVLYTTTLYVFSSVHISISVFYKIDREFRAFLWIMLRTSEHSILLLRIKYVLLNHVRDWGFNYQINIIFTICVN